MPEMFCFQCQQTAGNKGCVRTGVCGKQPDTAAAAGRAGLCADPAGRAAAGAAGRTKEIDRLLIDGLFTTLTNVNFDNDAIRAFHRAGSRRSAGALGGSTGRDSGALEGRDGYRLRCAPPCCFGMKGMAAYAHHALQPGLFRTRR